MAKVASPVVILGTFCLVFLVGYWVFLLPLLHKVGEAQAATQNQSNSTSAKSVAVAAPTTSQTQQILDLLPTGDNQYDLAVEIEALSRNLGIPLTSMSLSADSAASTGTATQPKRVVVTVSFTTDYDHVQSFVNGITSISRYMQVNQVVLTAASGTGSTGGNVATPTPGTSGQLTAQVTAYAYFLPTS